MTIPAQTVVVDKSFFTIAQLRPNWYDIRNIWVLSISINVLHNQH